MSASVSPPPSSEMNSSHSSEGSSVSGFVVVSKDDGQLLNSDDSKIGKIAEIPGKSESLPQGGSVSQNEHELADRVQNLSKENEQLKGVLLQNNELLEKYFEELADMQKSQKQTNESSRKGYERAKEMIKNLREKNGKLKTELKNEQNKTLQLEEELSKLKEADQNEKSAHLEESYHIDKANPDQAQSLNEVVKKLESERATLEMSNSKLQERISCLKAMREAEPNTETDDLETLVSLDTLSSDIPLESPEAVWENLRKVETEKEILKVKLEEMKIESEQNQQQFNQLEEERDQLLKKIQDMEQRQVLEEEDIELEVAENQASTAAATEQIAALSEQLRVQTEVMNNLTKEQNALRQERDMYKKKAEEIEQRITENVETIGEQQQNSPEKGSDNQEELKVNELRNTLEKVKKNLWEYQKREGDLLNREKAVLEKEEEQKQRTTENVETIKEQKQNSPEKGSDSQEELKGNEQYKTLQKVKKNLWQYQRREGDLLSRENAVLEKEEKQKQVMEENENLKDQLAEAQKNIEALSHKEKGQEEEVNTLKRQLSSVSDELTETHEQEVSQLKESLQTVIDSAKELRVTVEQLREENENLQKLVEELKLSASQKEEEIQTLKEETVKVSNELNEVREQEVNRLKEELSDKTEALTNAEINIKSMETQVTQLIKENEILTAEKERLIDECMQQENMYQDHLHKITDDSEKQRLRRDQLIESLKKNMSTTNAELKKTRLEKETDRAAFLQLQEDLDRTAGDYNELLQAYHTTSQTKTKHEAHLQEADEHRKKLKEDVKIKEDELDKVRQANYDLEQELKALRNEQEKRSILEQTLHQYEADFRIEREAREKQHGEILGLTEQVQRLQQENQRYQDEIYQLSNRGFVEMQRRHASVPYHTTDYPPHQQGSPGEWCAGFPRMPFFTRGSEQPAETGREGDMRSPGREQQVSAPPVDENDWQCPTCRGVFPNFDALQIHAVACQGLQRPPSVGDLQQNQCPSCMELFPDIETLELHVEECLDQHQ
ncbi:unnamed protein product [Pocillopora meandrina]|uniref:CCHC NOA-type domain-containing protein n=1 Tax=Pocillopora meandrina TaxID=46732 RepID=A0AAU9WU05_9CNID|nr:unnamed protein product [Pocillopora meandrina]